MKTWGIISFQLVVFYHLKQLYKPYVTNYVSLNRCYFKNVDVLIYFDNSNINLKKITFISNMDSKVVQKV